MTIEKFLTAIRFRVTEGSQYLWNSYGMNPYELSFEDDNTNYASCIYDTKTFDIYQINMIDYVRERAYIWINPLYRESYIEEANVRGVDPFEAYENFSATELYIIDDMLDKIQCMCDNTEYSTDILFPIDIDDELYNELVILAEETGITVEKLIENAVKESIAQYETSHNL